MKVEYKRKNFGNGSPPNRPVDEEKLREAIIDVVPIYEKNGEPYATPAQLALALRILKLYSEVPVEAVGNFLLESGVPKKYKNEKLYFHIPSVLENDQGVRARYSRISTPEEKSPTIVAHKKNKSSEAMTNDSQ